MDQLNQMDQMDEVVEEHEEIKTSFTVTVSVWENQRFSPLLQRWAAPWKNDKLCAFSCLNGEPLFAEESASASVCAESLAGLECAAGWEWRGDWRAQEGWVYAQSFAPLLALSHSAHAQSAAASFSRTARALDLVRRRRWVRDRCARSLEARAAHSTRAVWARYIRARAEAVVMRKQFDLRHCLEHESRRAGQFTQILSRAEQSLDHTWQELQTVADKLVLMGRFLNERALVERDYAANLANLAKKWAGAGQKAKNGLLGHRLNVSGQSGGASDADPENELLGDINGRAEVEKEVEKVEEEKKEVSEEVKEVGKEEEEESPSRLKSGGFFKVISRANELVSKNMNSFADTLSLHLTTDVSSLKREVYALRMDFYNEKPKLHQIIKEKETKLSSVFENYKSSFQASQARDDQLFKEIVPSIYDVEFNDFSSFHSLNNKNSSISANNNDKKSLRSGFLSAFKGKQAQSKDSVHSDHHHHSSNRVHFNGRKVLFSSTSDHGVDIVLLDPVSGALQSVSQDVWLSVHCYKACADDLNSAIFVYGAYADQFAREASKVAARVSALLYASVKIFAFEQTKVWDDATALLRQIRPDDELDDEKRQKKKKGKQNLVEDAKETGVDDVSIKSKVTTFDEEENDEEEEVEESDEIVFESDEEKERAERNAAVENTFPSLRSMSNCAMAGRLRFILTDARNSCVLGLNVEGRGGLAMATGEAGRALSRSSADFQDRSFPQLARLSHKISASHATSNSNSKTAKSGSEEMFYRMSSLVSSNSYDNPENASIVDSVWMDCMCVVTYDGFLHVFHLNSNEKRERESIGKRQSFLGHIKIGIDDLDGTISNKDNNESNEKISGVDEEVIKTRNKIKLDDWDILDSIRYDPMFSIHINSVEVGPSIIPIFGVADAIEVRQKNSSKSNPSAPPSNPILFLEPVNGNMGEWLRVISNPLIEVSLDLDDFGRAAQRDNKNARGEESTELREKSRQESKGDDDLLSMLTNTLISEDKTKMKKKIKSEDDFGFLESPASPVEYEF